MRLLDESHLDKVPVGEEIMKTSLLQTQKPYGDTWFLTKRETFFHLPYAHLLEKRRYYNIYFLDW